VAGKPRRDHQSWHLRRRVQYRQAIRRQVDQPAPEARQPRRAKRLEGWRRYARPDGDSDLPA
jgi:hypothetical protein